MAVISDEEVVNIAQDMGLLDDDEERLLIETNENYDFMYQDEEGKDFNFGAGLKGLEGLQEHLMLFANMHDLRVDETIDLLIDTRRAVFDYCLENHLEVKHEAKV